MLRTYSCVGASGGVEDVKPVKVVAADDEPGVLLLIHSILSELDGIQLVGTAGSAMEAIKLVDELKPDFRADA